MFLQVALPGSVPIVMAGLRLGIGRALTGVVIAELFGSTSGLGYSISLPARRVTLAGSLDGVTTAVAPS